MRDRIHVRFYNVWISFRNARGGSINVLKECYNNALEMLYINSQNAEDMKRTLIWQKDRSVLLLAMNRTLVYTNSRHKKPRNTYMSIKLRCIIIIRTYISCSVKHWFSYSKQFTGFELCMIQYKCEILIINGYAIH